MPRHVRHAAFAAVALLLLMGAGGRSSAAPRPTTVVLTCATRPAAAADQLRTMTLAEQRQYFAECGLPLTISPHCFSLNITGAHCHSHRGRLVLRSRG